MASHPFHPPLDSPLFSLFKFKGRQMYYLLDKYKRSLTLFLNVQMFNTWRTDNTTAFNSTMYRSCYKTIPFFATRNRLDHVFDPMCTSGIIVDACSLNLTFHLCLVSVNSTVPIDVGNGQLAKSFQCAKIIFITRLE